MMIQRRIPNKDQPDVRREGTAEGAGLLVPRRVFGARRMQAAQGERPG